MSAFAGQNKWTVRWLALQCAHFLSIELRAESQSEVFTELGFEEQEIHSLYKRGAFAEPGLDI